MECPATIEEWFKESISCYNQSQKDNVSLYNEDRAMFFFRQYWFAFEYALRSRDQEVDEKTAKQINAQVRHWFAILPEKYDEIANDSTFAFAFCYLFTNQLLGFIDQQTAWQVLGYLSKHWNKVDELVEIPEEIMTAEFKHL